ncbi:hypothetical protein [Saccharibacillus kuerlensis]|uniref:Uncharacterized protein n=1 Tax=Saccharibacillus kuerlensis TaxID=459527 RepID=A0ABQ2L3I1_9BACL|nr:hypothetical protein [Saccharibacillus kuerlensis]GGN99756.1 hypothetical protein GCM10010969_20170 [Saccharibacillus kuerlensis]
MKRSGTKRSTGAILLAASLIAVLSACSGDGRSDTTYSGTSSAESQRPAESSGSGAVERTRPEEVPADQAGPTSADEHTRPAEEDVGNTAAPTESRRPQEPTDEPAADEHAPSEQSRPDNGEAVTQQEPIREPVREKERPTKESPAQESATYSRPTEGSRPADEVQESDTRSTAEEPQSRDTVKEQSRPNASDSQAESDVKQSAPNERQRPTDSSEDNNENSRKSSETVRPEDAAPAEQDRPSEKTVSPKEEQNRPAQNPDWNGPAPFTERSRDSSVIPGSGHYRIGKHIQPGLYRSTGSIDYWERTSGLSGTDKDRIVRFVPTGQTIVEIQDSDIGFISKGSGRWRPVSSGKSSPKTEFGAGTYIVGTDIAPGRYRSSKGVQYWAILSGFSGEKSDIRRSGSPNSTVPVTVDIQSTDKGFTSTGASWIKID